MADTMTIPDLATQLRQRWPTLTDDQRQLILDLVWTLVGPASDLLAEIEDLEDELAIQHRQGEIELAIPFDAKGY